jgi:hypothetical protein
VLIALARSELRPNINQTPSELKNANGKKRKHTHWLCLGL